MSKKKEAQTVSPEAVEAIREEVRQEVLSEIALNEQTEIENILCIFGPDTHKVSLQRYDEETRKWRSLGTFENPTPDFVDFVKDNFGGGDYRVTLFDKSGQYIKGGMKTFYIDRSFSPKKSGNDPGPTSKALVPAQDNPSFVRLEMLLTKMIEMMVTQNQASKTDPLDTALKIAAILRPVEQPSSVDSVKNYLELFKQGLDIGRGLDGDSFWPFAEKMSGPVLELINKITPTNGKTIVDKANQVNPKEVKKMTMFDQLMKFIPQVIPAAKENRSHEDVIDEILDMTPPKFYDAIYTEVTKPDFLENVIKSVPAVKEQEAWFKEFVEKFKEMLLPDEETSTVVSELEQDE